MSHATAASPRHPNARVLTDLWGGARQKTLRPAGFPRGGLSPAIRPLPRAARRTPPASALTTSRQLNAGQIRWLYPLPSHRFHVLFNSLFKVLCNFPSQYLFAIGFVGLFSLRWSLPPASGCVPKQPDSEPAAAAASARLHRPCTFCGTPLKGDLGRAPATGRRRLYATAPVRASALDSSQFTRRYYGNPC